MQTTITKGNTGWKAKTCLDMTGDQVLVIDTLKNLSGALVTRATLNKHEGDFLTFVMFQDFTKRLESSAVRVTEKAVREQHARNLARLDEIKAEVAAFYAAKGE